MTSDTNYEDFQPYWALSLNFNHFYEVYYVTCPEEIRQLKYEMEKGTLLMMTIAKIEKLLIGQLIKLSPWTLLSLTLSSAVILATILVVPCSIYFHGRVTSDMVISAAIDSLIVALIICPLLVRLSVKLSEMASIVESSEAAIVGHSLEGRIISWNLGAEKLYGFSKVDVIGHSISLLLPPECFDDIPTISAKIANGEAIERFETVRKRKDGTAIDVSLTMSPIKNAYGKITGMSSIYNDISERKKAETLLRRWSTLDGLTGILNRRSFDISLEQEWKRAQRVGNRIAIFMIDVDLFKNYNDAYGHIQGDECLRQVSAALQKNLQRSGDLIARFGGEEFVIACSVQDEQHAMTFAKKICGDIEALKIQHIGSFVSNYVTVSIGVASAVPTLDSSQIDLLKYADAALYQAKSAGRNRVSATEDLGIRTGGKLYN